MIELQVNETELVGKWEINSSGNVTSNEVCGRIDWLVDNALIFITCIEGSQTAETLYKSPKDGSYWELIYPNWGAHGGGPPNLFKLTALEAKSKYELRENT
jgi:hypothetical protein